MLRKIVRSLVLTVTAFALLAPAANATPLLEAASYPASLTGSALEAQVFKTPNAAFKCSGLSLSGTLSKAASTVTVAPTYSGCTFWEGGLGAFSNGCTFQFHLEKPIEEELPLERFQSSLDILCPEGKAIEITTGFGICSWSYGAQTARSRVVFEDRPEFTPDSVILYFYVEGLKVTEKSKSYTCGEGTWSNGMLTGAVTLQGDTEKGVGQNLVVK
jgi:hypothetical protein